MFLFIKKTLKPYLSYTKATFIIKKVKLAVIKKSFKKHFSVEKALKKALFYHINKR